VAQDQVNIGACRLRRTRRH